MPRSPIAWTAICHPPRVCIHHISLKDFLAHHRQAEVVRVGIVQERLRDGGGAADQAAVDEEFDRAALQPVVAEAGADADGRQVRDQVLAQHQRRAQGIDARLRRPLEGAELRIGMNARVRAARDARREVALGAATERLDEVILGRLGDQVGDEFLRGFQQQPGRLPALVVDDPAAFRRLRSSAVMPASASARVLATQRCPEAFVMTTG